MTMHTELTRYKVKKGKEDKAREWMRFLNENIGETLLTLKNERMYVENIFSEVIDGQMYLYWFSYQGDEGQAVERSLNPGLTRSIWNIGTNALFASRMIMARIFLLKFPWLSRV